MAHTPAVSITLPVTISVGGLPCEVGAITFDAGDVAGALRRDLPALLRKSADYYEQTAEEVTAP
ncbi:hypothetical protein SFUL_5521 [Streptomyces microflavus DSM 40593]|uniref:Uncharacterized protein n=1 Tax=Streptomyces microflavus DSM 40593 TaxID=1303692 RepID=N0CZM3_STRMI|nr:hypothetical protein [Streptomyces microflavus]AGK80409.1 hypothetical protein SFUL_5521 [Streptomyces microflavus DSM 40593]